MFGLKSRKCYSEKVLFDQVIVATCTARVYVYAAVDSRPEISDTAAIQPRSASSLNAISLGNIWWTSSTHDGTERTCRTSAHSRRCAPNIRGDFPPSQQHAEVLAGIVETLCKHTSNIFPITTTCRHIGRNCGSSQGEELSPTLTGGVLGMERGSYRKSSSLF